MPRGVYERTAEYRAKLSAAHPKSYPPEFGAKVSAGKRQATCWRGHDLTDPANVYVRPNGKGRQCKPCLYERNRVNRARYDQERAQDPAAREAFRKYHSDWMREKRAKDPEYKARQLAVTRTRKAARRQMISTIKRERGCVDCGYNAEAAHLHFDHRNPAEKKFIISHGLLKPMEVLMAEIDKCDVRCASCHYARSADEQHYVNRRYIESGEQWHSESRA